MLKKVVIFRGRQILEVVIFWGIKYEPLSDPPPPPSPSLKFVSGALGVCFLTLRGKQRRNGRIRRSPGGTPIYNGDARRDFQKKPLKVTILLWVWLQPILFPNSYLGNFHS